MGNQQDRKILAALFGIFISKIFINPHLLFKRGPLSIKPFFAQKTRENGFYTEGSLVEIFFKNIKKSILVFCNYETKPLFLHSDD
jgi:hypothetical protein